MSNAVEIKDEGIKLFEQHDYEAAARKFQQAKDAYAEAGEMDMVAEMKVNIGLTHRALGETQQALELMQEALNTFEDQGDEYRMAQVLGNLGGVYIALDDKEQAELSYRQAAELFSKTGHDQLYADTLVALGAMQVRDGKFFEGAATYRIALESKDNLTSTQKIIKRLSGLISRFSGTETP